MYTFHKHMIGIIKILLITALGLLLRRVNIVFNKVFWSLVLCFAKQHYNSPIT